MPSHIPTRTHPYALRRPITTTAKAVENNPARPKRVASTGQKIGLIASTIARLTAPTAASKAKAVNSKLDATAIKKRRGALAEVISRPENSHEQGGIVSRAFKGKSKAAPIMKPTKRVVKEIPVPVPVIGGSKQEFVVAGPASSLREAAETPGNIILRAEVSEPSVAPVFTRPPVFKRRADGEAVRDDPRSSKRQYIDAYRSTSTSTSTVYTFPSSDRDIANVHEELVETEDETESVASPPPTASPGHAQATFHDDGEEVEADFEEQPWEDLDADDWDDPLMVSEYVVEICEYYLELEARTLPPRNPLKNHPDLSWEDRSRLLDWLIVVHHRFRFLPESLFLTTNVLDRYLGLAPSPMSCHSLQLLGVACLLIATKFEETLAPAVEELASLSNGKFTSQDVIIAERYVLKVINWDLNAPGPMGWVRRGSKVDGCEVKGRTIAKYLSEIAFVERKLVGVRQSLIAAAAMFLGRLVLGREEWTPTFAHYMNYTEAQLLPTANIILNYLLRPLEHPSLFRKYAHKAFFKCSVSIRMWALTRWGEGTVIDLAQEIGLLREDIWRQRDLRHEKDDTL